MYSKWLTAVLALCWWAVSAATVQANVGPSATSTLVVAEPVGIENVRIAHESLSIDLRPAQTGGDVLVEAVYNLENDGPEQALDLLFAFGSAENSDCSVTLDNRPIDGVLKDSEMPKEWWPPQVTPSLDGSGGVDFGHGWSTVQPLAFSITVPAGESVLAVRYKTKVKYVFARPAMLRQFAYILAPARAWAGFGGLDVRVQVPDDWEVAATPGLVRNGGLLQGRFDDVPADSIALTLRPPVSTGYRAVKQLGWGLVALLGVAGLTWCWRSAGAGALRDASSPPQERRTGLSIGGVVRSMATSLAFGVVMFAAGMAAAWGADLMFPPTAAERALIGDLGLSDGYASLGTIVGILLLAALAAGFAFVVNLVRRLRTGG